ncbi:MAG: 2-dehydropantoate 2-reductase [Anaerolineales bacterium]|nr:2-dehydropantoate 2-reductase [Anaerolineales bacterium]
MATPIGAAKLRILSFGAGAIGTYIGGSLAIAGHEIVFVERSEVATELRKRGLRLDLSADKRQSIQEALVVKPSAFVCAASLDEALNYGPFDVALFALKSFDTASALEEIKPLVGRMPPILCLQNGVDNEAAILSVLGPGKVIPATVTSAVGRRAAGDIVLEKLRGMGVAAGHPLSARLVEFFSEAGLNAKSFPEARDMKWSKMLTNLVSNATSAILDMTARQVFSDRNLYTLEMRQLREALAVMKAQNIRVVNLPGTPVKQLAVVTVWPGFIRPLVARILGSGRGGKMPSFHIDLHHGRGKSEVDWLNGAVVRAGEACGIPTPVNQLLRDTLSALTNGEMMVDEYAHQPEKLLHRLSQYEQ